MATIDDVYNLLVTVDGKIDTLQTDVTTLLTESQSHPTLAEIEASSILALEASVQNIKTQTDKMNFISNDIKATLDGEIVDAAGSGVELSADRYADFAETTY